MPEPITKQELKEVVTEKPSESEGLFRMVNRLEKEIGKRNCYNKRRYPSS